MSHSDRLTRRNRPSGLTRAMPIGAFSKARRNRSSASRSRPSSASLTDPRVYHLAPRSEVPMREHSLLESALVRTRPARMRVEELAGKAGVSVDTVRFYQKQHLLPPPVREGRVAWYTADHLARMARVKELRRRGFTLAVIRRFLDGELDRADEPLVEAVSEAAAPGGEEEVVSAEELAARSGVPLPLIDSLAREGLLVPRLHQ